MTELRRIGLSFGRVDHWHDGLGEFSRRLATALAAHAGMLRDEGLRLALHLPQRWHGLVGDGVDYLDTTDAQRVWHRSPGPFAVWHILHQHNRYRAPRSAAHVVETVHDLNFMHQKAGAKATTYRARLARRLASRSAVIAISRYVADDLQRELAPLTTPLHVIHNGVTDLTASPREPVSAVAGDSFLLHISRMAPTKNVAAILDLAQAWPSQHFVLAGPASDYTQAVAQRIDVQALHNVQLVLDVSDARKAWLYAQCAAFVFPSLAEGFGLPPLEAMCFGKPVFLSRLTSLPEVGGAAAFYFDTFDAGAMRTTIEAGLALHAAPAAPPAPRRDSVVAAHARSFTWQRCAVEHLALYRQLAQAA